MAPIPSPSLLSYPTAPMRTAKPYIVMQSTFQPNVTLGLPQPCPKKRKAPLGLVGAFVLGESSKSCCVKIQNS